MIEKRENKNTMEMEDGVYFEARERLSGEEGPVNNLNVDDFDLNDSDREEFENLVDILFVVD